jgi:hypothetical protein
MLPEKTKIALMKKLKKSVKNGLTEQEIVSAYMDAIEIVQEFFSQQKN